MRVWFYALRAKIFKNKMTKNFFECENCVRKSIQYRNSTCLSHLKWCSGLEYFSYWMRKNAVSLDFGDGKERKIGHGKKEKKIFQFKFHIHELA